MVEKLPIVYVRGYAGGTSGIDKQVDDPFYGFNDGSTHVRVGSEGEPLFYQFESPILRLVDDEKYRVLVHGDQDAYLRSRSDDSIPPGSIWVYRFYDASATTFGKKPIDFKIEDAATGLYDYVQLVRAKTGADRVHLVAHSMGGLVCRAMLQKASLEGGRTPGRDIVSKLFTYGTPHGGIEFDVGGGLIDWAMETFGPAGSDMFSPDVMYGYLTPGKEWGAKPSKGWIANDIPDDAFDPERVFCLIGTDAKDYGLSKKIVGPKSDGLVMIENAYVRRAHRAFVHRAHSGRYGLVNSDEGYQNLRRFLFGILQVRIELAGLDVPDPSGGEVWQAEIRLSLRGLPIVMHEQLAAHYCPIQLHLEEQQTRDHPDAPVPLTTVFLLDPTSARNDPLDPAPPRCRYALELKTIRLEEKHGFFSWSDHLEQIADWGDVLIVDVGRRDSDPENVMHAWAAWNSAVPGPLANEDPIAADPLIFVDSVAEVPFPESARKILGENARLRFTIAEWS
jgi:pimeloyl-ACP methyl ester carboxylesterase